MGHGIASGRVWRAAEILTGLVCFGCHKRGQAADSGEMKRIFSEGQADREMNMAAMSSEQRLAWFNKIGLAMRNVAGKLWISSHAAHCTLARTSMKRRSSSSMAKLPTTFCSLIHLRSWRSLRAAQNPAGLLPRLLIATCKKFRTSDLRDTVLPRSKPR
jgi:hypothetical protein